MTEGWVEVPASALSAEALDGLIEQYVLREGTEYGARDYTLAEKVARVRQQLEAGQVIIVYSAELEIAELLTVHAFQKRLAAGN